MPQCYNTPMERYDEQGHDMRVFFLGTEGAIRVNCITQQLLVLRYADFHPDAAVGKRVECRRIENHAHTGQSFFHDISENQCAFCKALATGEPLAGHAGCLEDACRLPRRRAIGP